MLPDKRPSESGFTLIEMMVALAIFSLTALALLRLVGATVRNTGEIETRTLGQIVTNNLAVEVLTDPLPPTRGTIQGVIENGGRQWRWTRDVKATADARIIRVDIRVNDQFGRPGGFVSLARPIT